MNVDRPKKSVKFSEKAQAMNPETGEEELIDMMFDSNAYDMLHRATVEWPCLSLDFVLPERTEEPSSFSKTWFP